MKIRRLNRSYRPSRQFREAIRGIREKDWVLVSPTDGDGNGWMNLWAEVDSVKENPRRFSCRTVEDEEFPPVLAIHYGEDVCAAGTPLVVRPSNVLDIWWDGTSGQAGFLWEYGITRSSGRLACGLQILGTVAVAWMHNGPEEIRGCIVLPRGTAVEGDAAYRVEIEGGPTAAARLMAADAEETADGVHVAFIGTIPDA